MRTSESKHNLKETTSPMATTTTGGGDTQATCVGSGGTSVNLGTQLLSAANHLEIPTNNPNLLSPDILNQRRGTISLLYSIYIFIVTKHFFSFSYRFFLLLLYSFPVFLLSYYR